VNPSRDTNRKKFVIQKSDSSPIESPIVNRIIGWL
jgi:hypothetical protein